MPGPLKKPTSISPSSYRQDVEEFYLLKNIDSSASVLNTTVDDTTDPGIKRRRLTYLRIQQCKNKLSLTKHFCTWIVKLILPKFLTTHPSLFDNLKSLSRNKEFKALRLAMVAWLVFSSSLLTFGYVALHYTNQSLWAAISTWTFDTAADYTYDVSKVTFSGGVASLIATAGSATSYIDNDNGATEFGGGTTSSVDWNNTSSTIELTATGKTNGTGTFTSRIIDNGVSTAWNELAWVPFSPSYKEFPNSAVSETAYSTGNVNMASTSLLLHLNETTGATTFTENSGNSLTVACTGGGCPTATSNAKFGNAFVFNGGQIITVTQATAINGDLTAETASAWFYVTSTPASGSQSTLVGKMNSAGHGWVLGVDNGGGSARFYIHSTNCDHEVTFANSAITVNTWHQLVGVNNGTDLRLYLDGALKGTNVRACGTITGNTSNILLGRLYSNMDAFNYSGVMDEVAVWYRALSAGEILHMYKRGAQRLKFQVRTCDDAACSGESFAGPAASTTDYYTELTTSTVGLPSKTLTGGISNRYFQYRATLETSSSTFTPAFLSVSTTAATGASTYPSDYPTIIPNTPSTYNSLSAFSQTLGGGNVGSVQYQLARNNTSTWYYWNNTNWVTASGGYPTYTNSSTVVNTNISQFRTDVGTGSLYWKAFLVSNGSQAVELDTVTTDYSSTAISFTSSTQSAPESAGSVNLRLQLNDASSSTVTVDYAVSGGTASGGGIDYTLNSGTATIAANATTTNISLSIAEDSLVEGSETITIALSNPSNASLGPTTTQTFTITDNDSAGVTITESSSTTALAEPSSTDTYTVVLASQPTATVTITIATSSPDGYSAGLTASAATLTFTSTTWNIAQTVTTTALDDSFAQGSHAATITHTSASSDSNFNGLTIAGITATITDNDTTGVTVSTSTLALTEGGATDSYTIVLLSAPTSTVIITPTNTLHYVTFSPTSLSFNSSTWNTPQTITVTVVNDSIALGSHSTVITHSASSTAAQYHNLAVNDVTASIIDNDTAGITLTESSGTAITEGGATDSYTLVLTSEPTSTVAITLANPDGQISLSTTSIFFTSTTWNQTQTITVTAVNDTYAEGTHVATITHTVSSTGTSYQGISISNVSVTITDNDTAGVTLSTTTLAVTEGSTTSSYTLVLTSQPTSTVTLTLTTSSAAITLSSSTLTFDSTNWNTVQTIVVTTVNDSVAEGTHPVSITHTATSANANYNGISISSVIVSITDNDTAGVTVSKNNVTTTEAGTTDTYTLVLTSQPTSTVTIAITNSSGDVTLSTSSIAFTAANWNSVVTTTVTTVNNSIAEGNRSVTITHTATSADTAYNGISINSVTAAITDNDTAGVTISKTNVTTTEAGTTDTYTIVLTSQPTSTVTIATANASGEVSFSTSSIAFTTTNWNTPVTVIVTAVNDAVADGAISATITHTATSGNTNYNGISINSVSASITDNDIAGVTLSTTTMAVTEGGTAGTYTIVLTSQPTSTVTVALTNASGELTLSTSSIRFTSSNWNIPITVTADANGDSIDQGTHTATITHSATSANTNYSGISINTVTATITDNDTAGVTVTQSGGTTTVTEGGTTDSYTIVLNSEPTSTVTVAVATASSDVTLSTSSIAFTALNWNSAVTVTVTAVNNSIADGAKSATITHTATSGNTNYNGISIAAVTVSITDNDTAGVTLSKTNVTTTEAGTTDTYTVVLSSQPTSTVTVAITNASGDVSLSTSSIAFTSANWSSAVTVTVTASNNNIAEGTRSVSIAHTATSVNTNYNGISINAVTATITDNDTAGVTVSKTNVTTTEAGVTNTYSLVLTSQPTSTVTIAIANSSSDVTLSTSSIAFTSANWNTAVTVTTTAVNDSIAQGTHTATITHSATSANTNYTGISIPSVLATITDNDTAGVTLSTNSITATEGGSSGSYTIVLSSQPTNTVAIAITTSSIDIGLSTTTLYFTSSNWNTPQTVTVTAVDDSNQESTETATTTHTSVSNSGNYQGISIAAVTITITDNDVPGVSLTQSGAGTTVVEGGETDTYTVVLTTLPTNTVTITPFTSSTQITFSPALLTFTTGNFDTPQTITVTAVNDSDIESTGTALITHAAASSDNGYQAISIAGITVSITDNDTIVPTATTAGSAPASTELPLPTGAKEYMNDPSANGIVPAFSIRSLETEDGKSIDPTDTQAVSQAKSIFGPIIRSTHKQVTLRFNAGTNVTRMAISRTPDFHSVSQQPYQDVVLFDLCQEIVCPRTSGPALQTVYVKFFTKNGVSSRIIAQVFEVQDGTIIGKNDKQTEFLIKGDSTSQIYRSNPTANTLTVLSPQEEFNLTPAEQKTIIHLPDRAMKGVTQSAHRQALEERQHSTPTVQTSVLPTPKTTLHKNSTTMFNTTEKIITRVKQVFQTLKKWLWGK